ncbi:MAG: lamin tail domain-containing protein [Saprospiraceae bacterium]
MHPVLRRCLPLLFAMGVFQCALAQIADDFSDGDFTQNPAWSGDAANFIVNTSGQLQLNAPDAGTSMLSVQGNIADSAIWLLDVRLEFAPSAANLLRIYLLADQADLTQANGYFLEIGENGSNDAIRFYRQDGPVKTLLATGTPGLVANEPVVGSLRMRRSASGLWSLDVAPGANPFQPELAVTDATYAGGPDRWFGVQCVYSATRKDKFYFDNLSIQPDAPDTAPPVLLGAGIVNDSTLEVSFDEALDVVSAENPANYSVQGAGQAVTAALAPGNPTKVIVGLSGPLTQSGVYQLQTSQIADLAGNVSAIQSTDFQFILLESAGQYDILINEIMADPSPSVGLPEVEWAELFNRSGKYIDLQQLRFYDSGGTPAALPSYVLAPDSFVVLCAPASALSLKPLVPNTLGISGFPSLNNTGDWLILADAGGVVINQVSYQLNWHTDPDKEDGGWSLERINPNRPCLGSDNWQSSSAPSGGTPGRANSGLQTAPDTQQPALASAVADNATTVRLQFSEGLDQEEALASDRYHITPDRQILTVSFPGDDRSVVQLSLAEPLESGVRYGLSVDSLVRDCSGNGADPGNIAYFGLAEAPQGQDLIFNEIMFKPAPSQGLPEVEWVEIVNRSGKFLQLNGLLFSDAGTTQYTLPEYVLEPDSVLVLCSAANLAALAPFSDNLLAPGGFPSLNDDQDALNLRTASGAILDRIVYSAAWHTDANKRDGGWSIERINPTLPCIGKENWQSCPAAIGGTPGRQNASYSLTPDDTPPAVVRAYTVDASTVLLIFSEGLDDNAIQDPSVFHLSPAVQAVSADFQDGDKSRVEITLNSPLQPRTLYALSFGAALTDCSGNPAAATDTVFIGLPERPEPADVVINEILFNPAAGSSRYVELLNRSDKIFDLSQFTFDNARSTGELMPLTLARLFLPGEYLVFTKEPLYLALHYTDIRAGWLLYQELPSLDDRNDNFTVLWSDGNSRVTVDSLDYSDDWHNALLSISEREGVALERIRPDGPTNSAFNWTSAAQKNGSDPGTPTQPNSQRLTVQHDPADDIIQLPQARLSPDDDGFEDYLPILYQLPGPGYFATFTLYDSEGIPVKRLVRQELIGTAGQIRWDGDSDDGTRVRPGIYVLYAEIFEPNGAVKKEKKAVSVVARF